MSCQPTALNARRAKIFAGFCWSRTTKTPPSFLIVAMADHGHEVEHVRNGTEALVVAAAYRPHIVLVDIHCQV